MKIYIISLTQNTLDQLSSCLHNLKILIAIRRKRAINCSFESSQLWNQQSSLDFVKFKKLKKLALDINHLIPTDMKIDSLFIRVVYGEKQDGNGKDEFYYRYIPKNE